MTLEEELKKLEKPPLLPKEEQELVDKLAGFMVERALQDETRGIRHKRVRRKK